MEASVSPASSRGRAVLLVDDTVEARGPLAELLRANGYQVLEAATSDGALDLLNSRLEIDALIAHEHVRGPMGGLALAEWVRKTRPAMRVLVVSDQQHAPDVPDENNIFLVRPFPFEDLLAVLPPVGGDP